tara:strand:- start:424 stop:714 length:291 start_codon:yes stop_codon:yes gene_type:complete
MSNATDFDSFQDALFERDRYQKVSPEHQFAECQEVMNYRGEVLKISVEDEQVFLNRVLIQPKFKSLRKNRVTIWSLHNVEVHCDTQNSKVLRRNWK